MTHRWPFIVSQPAAPAVTAPRVLCAACESAEAPNPSRSPLCDDCGERLAGFGVPGRAQVTSKTTNHRKGSHMPAKTPEQIHAEVGKLQQLKPTVRRFSNFGDDNHQAIDAAITVLSELLDEDEVHERFDPASHPDPGAFQQVLDTAVRAHAWMTGRTTEAVSAEGWPLAADQP